MAAQIFQLRALPGATVTLSIDIQPNISSLEAPEISEPTESRSRIICHKRTTTTCNSLNDKNAFKGKGFRLAKVVSRESKTSGEVHIARDFINRADGRRNTVLFMHAEKQGVKGTCKQEKRELVAIKFSRGEDATSSAASVKGDNAVLKHENAVLQFLKGKEIPHVIQPFQLSRGYISDSRIEASSLDYEACELWSGRSQSTSKRLPAGCDEHDVIIGRRIAGCSREWGDARKY
jgi:hypothetical protein